MLPSSRAGLHAGDECLGIVDSNDPASLMIDLGDGIDVRPWGESHGRELWKSTELGGGLLVELLKTRPKVLLGGLIFQNPQYLSVDEYRFGKS
jgi:hypothetical protein